MAGSRIRVRLLFDDCSPSRPGSVGRRRCWFLLNSDACRLVTDVEYCIRETFCLGKSTQIELFLDDFVLPPFEKSEIIRENDIIRVKLLGDIQRQGRDPESELSDEDTGILRKKKAMETLQNGENGSDIDSSTACVSKEGAQTKKMKGRQNKEKKKEHRNKRDPETTTGKAPAATSTRQTEIRKKQTEAVDRGKSKESSLRSRSGHPENVLDITVSRKTKSSSVTSSKKPGPGQSRKESSRSSSSSSSEEESVRDKSSKLQNGVAKKIADQSTGKARKDAAPQVASKSNLKISQSIKVKKVDQSFGSGTDDSDSSSTESSSTEEDDAKMTRIKTLPLSKTGKRAALKGTQNAKRLVVTVGKPKVPAQNNAMSAVPSAGKSSRTLTVNGKANPKEISSSSSTSSLSGSESEENDLTTSHNRAKGGDKLKAPVTSTSLQQNATPKSPCLVPAVKTINSTPAPSHKTASVNNVRQSTSKSKAGHVRFSSGSDADSDSDSHAASSLSIISNSKQVVQSLPSTANKRTTKDAVSALGLNGMDENRSAPPSINGHTDIQKRLQSLSEHNPQRSKAGPRPAPKAASPKPPPKPPSPKPPPRDYSSCPPLVGPPRPGDVIAYKTLELSSSYTPEVSAYKEGEVLNMNHSTSMIELRLSDPSMGKEPSREGGRFELVDPDAGADEAGAGAEAEGEATVEIGPQLPTVPPPVSRVVSVTMHSLIEPKLVT